VETGRFWLQKHAMMETYSITKDVSKIALELLMGLTAIQQHLVVS